MQNFFANIALFKQNPKLPPPYYKKLTVLPVRVIFSRKNLVERKKMRTFAPHF